MVVCTLVTVVGTGFDGKRRMSGEVHVRFSEHPRGGSLGGFDFFWGAVAPDVRLKK